MSLPDARFAYRSSRRTPLPLHFGIVLGSPALPEMRVLVLARAMGRFAVRGTIWNALVLNTGPAWEQEDWEVGAIVTLNDHDRSLDVVEDLLPEAGPLPPALRKAYSASAPPRGRAEEDDPE